MNINNGWSKEIPIKDGEYWFYGYPFKMIETYDEKPRMCFIEVRINKNTSIPFLVYKGSFLSRQDIIGIWKEIEYPKLPDDINDVLILLELMNG